MAQNNTLGRNIEFPIMNSDGTPFHALVLHKATYESTIMSLGDKITGDVYYADNTLAVTMQEYIEYGGVHYVLVTPPTIVKEGIVSDNGQLNGMTKYSFTFYHPMYMLSNFPFSDVAVTSDETQYLSESKKFSWCGTGIDFIAKLNKNLENTQWVVATSDNTESLAKLALLPSDVPANGSTDTTKSNVLTFDNVFISDALKTLYDTWEVPFVVDTLNEGEYYDSYNNDYYESGKMFVVVVGLPSNEILDSENEPFVFQFGKGVGLKNNSRTPRNNKIITRIAGTGSERNIPYGYPQVRWYGAAGAKFTYGDSAGVYTNVTIGGHTFSKVVSYPIYKGILGGQYVELIKHPFTRKTLMPSIYATTLFNKISPYLANGSVNTNYNPDLTIVDYYDAIGNTYPNPIVPDAPSYETHQFDNVYPRLGSAEIVGVLPYDEPKETTSTIFPSVNLFLNVLNESIGRTNNGNEKAALQRLYNAINGGMRTYADSNNGGSYTFNCTVTNDGNGTMFVKYTSDGFNIDTSVTYAAAVVEWDDTMDDDGKYKQQYFKMTLPQLDFDLYACANITEQMNIVMRSGSCIGCTFEVSVDWDDYKNNFFHEDGSFDPTPHTSDGDGHVRDATKYPNSANGQITVIVKKDLDTFGVLMPNTYQQPVVGDEFVITGISLPESYITKAELELETTSQQYMLENNVHYYDYPLKFDEYFLATHTNILSQIRNNTIIEFKYGNETPNKKLYVKQISIKYGEKPLPQYDITLTDDVEIVLNQIGQVTDDVSRMRVQVSELQKYYSENLIQEINQKLSRIQDDVCQGRITFQQGLDAIGSVIFHDEVRSPQFESGLYTGRGWRIDNLGNAEFESIRIRSYLEVVELLINRLQAQEGDTIFTDNDQIDRVDRIVDETDGSVSYVLSLKEKYQGYITGQMYGNVIKGIINTLAAKQAGVSDYQGQTVEVDGSNTYYTSWMRVIGTHNIHNPNVNLGVNQIQVVLYGDNDTPAKKNFAPCELMTIARWGCVDYSDPEDTDYESIKASIIRRQRMFMISTTDGRVVKYTGVDSPILRNGNYGVTIGELPEFVKNYPDVMAILNQVGEHTDWLYAQGVVVGKFIKVDIEGNPEPNIIDCGNWVDGANVVNPTPRNGVYLYNEWNSQTQQYETHDVWHNNAKWRCLQHQPVIIGGVSTYYEPTDANSAYWQKLASGGQDGEDAHEVNPNILLRTIFDKGIDFVKEKWGGNYSYISIDTSSDTVIEGRKCVRINASSLPSLNYIDFSQNVYSRIKPNTWYTLSFNYFATEQFTTYIYDGYNTSGVVDQNAGFYVDGTFVSGIGIDGNHSWPSNWNGLRHTLTFKTKSSFGTSEAIIIFRVFGGSQLAICMPKLETGDAATAYMAHEEDLKGTDGTSPFIADLDNEMDSVACDVDGKPSSTQTVSTNVKLYYGTSQRYFTVGVFKDAACTQAYTNSSTLSNGIAVWWNSSSLQENTINVKVSNALTIDGKITLYIRLTDSKDNSIKRILTFTINGVRPGENGEPATVYNIVPSLDKLTFSRKVDGSLSPSNRSFNFTVRKVTGTSITELYSGQMYNSDKLKMKYSIVSPPSADYSDGKEWPNVSSYIDEDAGISFNYGTATIPNSVTFNNIYLALFKEITANSYVLVDRETIPVIKDGNNGKDAFVVDLENEMTNVALTEGGNTLTAVDFYFKVRAFYGTSDVLGDNDCTVSASCSDSNVTLTTTAAKTIGIRVQVAQNVALANSTDITVTVAHATYGTRIVVFTLAGVRGGENAVLQELLPSLDAISFARLANGGLSPDYRDLSLSIKKTQGGTTSTQTTSASRLTIKWAINSMPTTSQSGYTWENGSETGISWSGTTMQIANTVAATNIYIAAFNSGGTLVDRETIPIIKDGNNGIYGENGVSYDIEFTTAYARVDENNEVTANLAGYAYKYVGDVRSALKNTTIRYGYILNDPETYADITTDSSGFFDAQSWFDGDYITDYGKNSPSIFAAIIISGQVVCTKMITISVKGNTGNRGKIGRFFYYAQEWYSTPSISYKVSDAEAPYFLYNNNYWVFNPTANGTYTMAEMGTPSSSNEKWELMVTDFKYIITEAIFGNYAHFGSFIINGDWMISQHGKVNGETTNSNATVSGTIIASAGNTSFAVKAYTIFDNESPTGESDLTARGTNESISSSASSSTLASSVPLNNFYTYCLKCKGHRNSSNRPVYLRIRNSNPNCSWQAITLPTGSDSELSVYFRVAESSANYVVDLYQPTTGGGASVTEWSISRIKFAPNFAVDGLTGKTYQNDAYIKGVVEAVDGIFNGELTAGDMKVTRRQESNHVWSGMYTPSLSEAVSIGVRNYSNNSYSGEILLLGSGAAGGYVYTYAGGDETGSRFELSYARPTGTGNRSRIVLASGDTSYGSEASISVQTTVASGGSATVITPTNVSTTNVDTSTIHVDTIYPKTTNGYVSIPSNIITGSGTKYLPSNPQKGMVIFAKGTTGSLTISGNGKPIMGANGTNTDSSITIGNASFFFVYDGDRWIRYCCTE